VKILKTEERELVEIFKKHRANELRLADNLAYRGED
jgi:uncharacterized membrane protein